MAVSYYVLYASSYFMTLHIFYSSCKMMITLMALHGGKNKQIYALAIMAGPHTNDFKNICCVQMFLIPPFLLYFWSTYISLRAKSETNNWLDALEYSDLACFLRIVLYFKIDLQLDKNSDTVGVGGKNGRKNDLSTSTLTATTGYSDLL